MVEDPLTAAHRTMPDAALARSDPDWVLPLHEIASRINALGMAIAV
jgi:hypothetical protein